MNNREFNEKYKDYLETGFEDQGLEFSTPYLVKYLDKLFTDLIKIPGFKYSQIKCKFNECRFYTNIRDVAPSFSMVINKAESHISEYFKFENIIRNES